MTHNNKYHDSSSTLLVLLLFKIPTALYLVCFCPFSGYIPVETYIVKTSTNMHDTVLYSVCVKGNKHTAVFETCDPLNNTTSLSALV